MEISPSLDPAAPDGIDTFLGELNIIPNISIHLDVMDGNYVPRKNISLEQYHRVIENSAHPVDSHLMISNPSKVWKKYFSPKLRSLCFHVEAETQTAEQLGLIKQIKKAGISAGVAIDKQTKVQDISTKVLNLCDVVTIMTIKAGLSGQQFQPELLEKVEFIKKKFPHIRVIVDGGINQTTAPQVIKAGGDTLVMGMYIYKASDRRAAIKEWTI